VIAGPTAVGKTGLSIRLAAHYGSVILSADSRQFYKEMNIGTAKPTNSQLNEAPHFFVGNKSVGELYGAGHFEKDAMVLLNDLFKKYQVVFMTGGSGLYIDAVLNGVDDFVAVPEEIRKHLNAELETKGLNWLQNEINTLDPDYFKTVDPQNPQRLIRALEVIRFTGAPYSSFLSKTKTERPFTPIKILINTTRQKLYDQINGRVDDMIGSGLVDEVKSLLPYKEKNALKTVGYKEIFDYLDGKVSLEIAIDKIKQHTRNYAKRQITWFKNRDQFKSFEPDEVQKIINYIDGIIGENT